MDFSNVVAFVTGANRGIGRTFVEELADAGARKIYAAARNPETLQNLTTQFAGRVAPVELDVTKKDQVTAAVQTAADVNLLINNAGVAGYAGLIAAPDIEAARQEMETNYFGVLNTVRAFAPALEKNGGGTIINIASIASHVNFPFLGSYSASKAAVHSLTQGIRAELAEQGTSVYGVYPGPVDTDMTSNVEMEKTPTNTVVKAVLDAMFRGEQDIYPDDMSKEMHAGLMGNPASIEKQAGEMLPA